MGWVTHKASVGLVPKERIDQRIARLESAIRKAEGHKRAELEAELARVRLSQTT